MLEQSTVYEYVGIALGAAAFIATGLPAPNPATKLGMVYGILYKMVNILACNWGQAKNAKDTK